MLFRFQVHLSAYGYQACLMKNVRLHSWSRRPSWAKCGTRHGVQIKDRQARIELVMKNVQRATASTSPLHPTIGSTQNSSCYGWRYNLSHTCAAAFPCGRTMFSFAGHAKPPNQSQCQRRRPPPPPPNFNVDAKTKSPMSQNVFSRSRPLRGQHWNSGEGERGKRTNARDISHCHVCGPPPIQQAAANQSDQPLEDSAPENPQSIQQPNCSPTIAQL